MTAARQRNRAGGERVMERKETKKIQKIKGGKLWRKTEIH
jgi:hypothetical protein